MNGYESRRQRQRRIIGQIDVDTPVADLNDNDDAGDNHLVLFSDGQRRALALLIHERQEQQEVIHMRSERRRWHEAAWVRWTALLAGLGTFGSAIAGWVSLFTHH